MSVGYEVNPKNDIKENDFYRQLHQKKNKKGNDLSFSDSMTR
jgi:hypothetical protein